MTRTARVELHVSFRYAAQVLVIIPTSEPSVILPFPENITFIPSPFLRTLQPFPSKHQHSFLLHYLPTSMSILTIRQLTTVSIIALLQYISLSAVLIRHSLPSSSPLTPSLPSRLASPASSVSYLPQLHSLHQPFNTFPPLPFLNFQSAVTSTACPFLFTFLISGFLLFFFPLPPPFFARTIHHNFCRTFLL